MGSNPIGVARKAKGLTSEALAKAVGVSRKSVTKWEHWVYCPSHECVTKLKELLDLSDLDVWRITHPSAKRSLNTVKTGRRKPIW